MIIQPELLHHPKFIELKTMLGDIALEYLVRLWGHCQQNMRGQAWPHVNADYVEVICCGKVTPKRSVFGALKACRWVDEATDGITIHDWEVYNEALVARWKRTKQEAAQRAAQGSAQVAEQGSVRVGEQRPVQGFVQGAVKGSVQRTIGYDRIGGGVGGDNKGAGGGGIRERALRTQWVALNSQIQEMTKRVGELTALEREELRKKKRELTEITKRQAEGKF